ncbi:hypothetical protein SDJN02_07606, partial [Cucurbita argyrosperma subsp. argyrosperma]
MVLRRLGRNRSFNRENPDILIMMIAVDQIIRGHEQDKGDGTERKGMGPLKPVTKSEWLCTQGQISLSPLSLLLSPHPLVFSCAAVASFYLYLVGPFPPSPPSCRVLLWPLHSLSSFSWFSEMGVIHFPELYAF